MEDIEETPVEEEEEKVVEQPNAKHPSRDVEVVEQPNTKHPSGEVEACRASKILHIAQRFQEWNSCNASRRILCDPADFIQDFTSCNFQDYVP